MLTVSSIFFPSWLERVFKKKEKRKREKKKTFLLFLFSLCLFVSFFFFFFPFMLSFFSISVFSSPSWIVLSLPLLVGWPSPPLLVLWVLLRLVGVPSLLVGRDWGEGSSPPPLSLLGWAVFTSLFWSHLYGLGGLPSLLACGLPLPSLSGWGVFLPLLDWWSPTPFPFWSSPAPIGWGLPCCLGASPRPSWSGEGCPILQVCLSPFYSLDGRSPFQIGPFPFSFLVAVSHCFLVPPSSLLIGGPPSPLLEGHSRPTREGRLSNQKGTGWGWRENAIQKVKKEEFSKRKNKQEKNKKIQEKKRKEEKQKTKKWKTQKNKKRKKRVIQKVADSARRERARTQKDTRTQHHKTQDTTTHHKPYLMCKTIVAWQVQKCLKQIRESNKHETIAEGPKASNSRFLVHSTRQHSAWQHATAQSTPLSSSSLLSSLIPFYALFHVRKELSKLCYEKAIMKSLLSL